MEIFTSFSAERGISVGRITVVTSGKGGTGKSTVSAGLGCALAEAGASVLLVDVDAGLRSLDLLLGIGREVVFDLSDIFAGNCEPIRAVYPSPACPNLSLLPAPASPEGLCSPTDMRRLCLGFARHYDFIFLDCPAGTGRGFEVAVRAADTALVVTTPDVLGARDAEAVGALLAERDVPARLIINRLRVEPVLRGKLPNLDEIIDLSGLQLIGVIPEDEELPIAAAQGQPLPAHGQARLCLRAIARRLCGEEVPLTPLR